MAPALASRAPDVCRERPAAVIAIGMDRTARTPPVSFVSAPPRLRPWTAGRSILASMSTPAERLDQCGDGMATRGAASVRSARGANDESVTAKATILIVDDEPDVREVLEEYFVAHGYAVARRRERRRGAGARRRPRRSISRWSTSTCPARTA